MLCLSFYEWRCIDAGEQMILAPFLEKTSRDRAPGRFADFLFAPKHAKADVLLTTNMGPLRWEWNTLSRGHSLYRGSDGGWRCPPLPSRLAAQGRGAG